MSPIPTKTRGENESAGRSARKPTKELIFETAIELFSRDGYRAVSVRDITGVVGIKESSLYKHFRSKEEILDTIFDYFLSEMQKVQPPPGIKEIMGSIPPATFLERSFRVFLKYADTPMMAKIYRIIVIEQFRNPRARDILLGLYRGPVEAMERYFREAADKGIIKEVDPQTLAVAYQYALHALVAEYSILKSYHMDTGVIQERISNHIQFIGNLVAK